MVADLMVKGPGFTHSRMAIKDDWTYEWKNEKLAANIGWWAGSVYRNGGALATLRWTESVVDDDEGSTFTAILVVTYHRLDHPLHGWAAADVAEADWKAILDAREASARKQLWNIMERDG